MTDPFRFVEPGWTGMFTRDQAEGAMPNGTRIVKVVKERNDFHEIGALGTVIGSIGDMPDYLSAPFPMVKYAYFIEWDDLPKHAVGVMDYKIAELTQSHAATL